MIVSLKSDIGKKREENQDCIFYSTELGFPVFLLADGMGGHNGGAFASREAVRQSFEFLKNCPEIDKNNIKAILSEAIVRANRSLHEQSKAHRELSGMGTTLIISVLIDNVLYTEHVGDSRVYVLREQQIFQITEDHTYVSALIKLGELTVEQAKYHPYKNKITRAVGSEERVESDFYCVTVQPEDIILICSDGLTKMVSNQAILSYFAKCNCLTKSAEDLVTLANNNGGSDNTSVIVIYVGEVKE